MRWIRTILTYGAGLLFWLIAFGILQYSCVFDIGSVVDRLWMNNLHDDLAKNIIEELAFHVRGGRCVDRFLYAARYNPLGMDREGKFMSLTSLVDASTWRYAGSQGIVATYVDAKHRYNLYIISDDEYILAENR